MVNRYFETGVDLPPTLPAALDTTVSQDRSYFALWTGDPPNPPDLATASVIDVLDGTTNGNFMIRGFGTASPVVEIPTLSGFAALLTALLLVGLSWRRLRRQHAAR